MTNVALLITLGLGIIFSVAYFVTLARSSPTWQQACQRFSVGNMISLFFWALSLVGSVLLLIQQVTDAVDDLLDSIGGAKPYIAFGALALVVTCVQGILSILADHPENSASESRPSPDESDKG